MGRQKEMNDPHPALSHREREERTLTRPSPTGRCVSRPAQGEGKKGLPNEGFREPILLRHSTTNVHGSGDRVGRCTGPDGPRHREPSLRPAGIGL